MICNKRTKCVEKIKDLLCRSVTDEEENSDDNLSLEEISSEEGSVIGEEEKKPSKKDF